MEVLGIIIVILVILGAVFLALRAFYQIFFLIYWSIRLFFKRYIQPLQPRYRKILNKYFAYYKILPSKEKKLFEDRLKLFMYSKEFIPRGFPKATDEMRVLISASAVQLTFGLPMVYLKSFKRILIYPDTYYSNINKQYPRG